MDEITQAFALREEVEETGHTQDREPVFNNVQRDNPGRDGRADIRTENDADSLSQRHHAGIDEADKHDRRNGAGLDQRRDCARSHRRSIGCP